MKAKKTRKIDSGSRSLYGFAQSSEGQHPKVTAADRTATMTSPCSTTSHEASRVLTRGMQRSKMEVAIHHPLWLKNAAKAYLPARKVPALERQDKSATPLGLRSFPPSFVPPPNAREQ